MSADIFKVILPSLLVTKDYQLETESDYVPFVVNKALSYHNDCVLFANEMNKLPNLDKKLQYDFLLNTIRSYKRPFRKWHKKENLETIEVVKEYYNYSDAKAREALSILSDDEIDVIKKKLNKGGLSNDKHKRTG